MANELKAQLCKGVFEMYDSALSLTGDSLKKLINEPTKVYLNSLRYYYTTLACVSMKNSVQDNFQKTGEGYGKQITYMTIANESMGVACKDLVRYFI